MFKILYIIFLSLIASNCSLKEVSKIHGVKMVFGDPDSETGRASMNEAPGSEFELDVDLVLLAMGFVHPIHEGMVQELGLDLDARENVSCDQNKMRTFLRSRHTRAPVLALLVQTHRIGTETGGPFHAAA